MEHTKYYILSVVMCFLISSNLYSQQFTWYETNSPVTTRLNGIAVYGSQNPNQFWFCGDNGVVFKTTNNGSTYINRTGNGIPANVNLITIAVFDTGTVVTAGVRSDTAFVYRTTNSGLNWQMILSQPGGYINAINLKINLSFQKLIGFMTGNPVGGRWSLWRTTNSGLTWDSTGKYVPQAGSETGFPGSLAYIDTVILFGTNNGRIYRSADDGNSWSARTVAGEQDPSAFDMAPSYLGPAFPMGDVGGLSTIQTTTDGGLNWSNNPYSLLGTGRIEALEGHPGGVFDNTYIDEWYVRNDNKIYHSFYSNWGVHYTAPSGNYTYMSQGDYISIYIAAVRDNGGITFCNCQIWGAVKNLEGTIPNNYSLFQNYPNPFNPSTKIKFLIPADGKRQTSDTKLVIYDALGREVETLVNQQLKPGTYEVEWDGTNSPSGVYFYKLETVNSVQTKKMALIK